MFNGLIVFWFELLNDWGYLGVIVLMAMESSIFPVPSEVVIPPAVYWATEGRMSFWGVVLAGTLGSYIGSAITYWVARWLGRAFVERYGKWVRLTPASLDRAERVVHRYEASGVFFSRLLPVVRHVISIPAGLIRMNFWVFSLVTTAGSFLWCWILAKFSETIFERHSGADLMGDPEAMIHLIKVESLPLIAGLVVLCALYFVAIWMSTPKQPAGQ